MKYIFNYQYHYYIGNKSVPACAQSKVHKERRGLLMLEWKNLNGLHKTYDLNPTEHLWDEF